MSTQNGIDWKAAAVSPEQTKTENIASHVQAILMLYVSKYLWYCVTVSSASENVKNSLLFTSKSSLYSKIDPEDADWAQSTIKGSMSGSCENTSHSLSSGLVSYFIIKRFSKVWFSLLWVIIGLIFAFFSPADLCTQDQTGLKLVHQFISNSNLSEMFSSELTTAQSLCFTKIMLTHCRQ